MINDIKQTQAILNSNFKSGPMQEQIDFVNSIFHRLGAKGNIIGANDTMNADAFRAQIAQHIFNLLKTQTGVQAKDDAERAKAAWASIGNSPEGNAYIVQIALNLAQRKQDKAIFIRGYMRDHKGGRVDAEQAWRKHAETLPSVVPSAPANANPAAAPSGGRHYRYDPAQPETLLEN